ncbi:non-ribosomal peptide synthetase [Clostridium tagluense]|uniref:non-ribosomal peptide synthetase n=1 Tax=Clostridium tagluense TaxID=360422 RepID=UPI001CF3CE24|nr:non-ribosomal peptide synthetase [Clostridium tagluense]MCB2298642.1 amino acid adenylation domain-containing protein [Clostridium tagluense]
MCTSERKLDITEEGENMGNKIQNRIPVNEKEYWIEKLSGDIKIASFSNSNSNIYTYDRKINTLNFRLSNEVFNKILSVSNNSQYGIYMILLSGVNYILHRYSKCSDIVIGVTRIKDHINKTNYNKIYPLRIYINEEYTFKEFLIKTTKDVKELYQFSNYPLDKVMEQLEPGDLVDLNDLLKTVVLLRNIHEEKSLKDTDGDILFCFNFKDEYLELNLEYNSNLFSEEYIEQIVQCLFCYLENVMKNPNVKLCDVEILNEEEKNKLLYEFNDTYTDYPKDKTIHELFEEQVERTPDNIAVVFEDTQLTYRELNTKSNQLAILLRSKGVQADSIVGIMVERSFEMIIGIMGVLKAGGAYLPIDSSYPQDRIKYMIEDSNAKILLMQEHFMETVSHEGEIINLNDEGIYNNNAENLDNISSENKLAYVIYTSGSTGKPKGVMIEHQGLTNYIWWAKKMYLEDENEVMALYSSISFDLTATSIFTPLISGNQIVIYDTDETEFVLYKILKENKATVVKLTPAHLTLLKGMDNSNSSIKRFIVGGEDLKVSLAKEIYNSFGGNIEICNEYGPTETVVGCMIYKYNKDEDKGVSVPIGCPSDNAKVYILDNDFNVVPMGIVGEIYVGGDGVARGYLNRKELTYERFIENPFIKGKKMYRTGDLARWLPGGNIEFCGRIDTQVKIRGFRIELGEIESVLLKLKGINEAIVIDKGENEDKYLCAYIIDYKDYTVEEIRRELKKTLPEYMIPSYFIKVDKMPLNTNGKLDRKALTKLEIKIKREKDYEAPKNKIEKRLAEVWNKILDIQNIGIKDNFFELGGNSLTATKLMSIIYYEFNIRIPLNKVFNSLTIENIEEYINNGEKDLCKKIEKAEWQEYYPLSSAQKRMFILNQFSVENLAYNIPEVIKICGSLNIESFEEAWRQLIERHESLRTSFHLMDNNIVQKINNNGNLNINYIELGNKSVKDLIHSFVKPFDLSCDPLFRLGLLKLNADEHMLFIDIHHIISDAISISILFEEFGQLYSGNKLPELKIQYKDYAVWQNEIQNTAFMRKQKEYWMDVFKEQIPNLELPIDFSKSNSMSFKGKQLSFKLGKKSIQELNDVRLETQTTLYMVLLTAYNILLYKYGEQEDILVGSPIAGRKDVVLDGIVGIFINTIVMRNYPNKNKTIREFLNEVKENALLAYENQDYPFEELVNNLNIHRELNQNPMFDAMFILQNAKEAQIEVKELSFIPYKFEHETTIFDILLEVIEKEDSLTFKFEYNTAIFKNQTIERLAISYKKIVNTLIRDLDIRINNIEV